MLKLTIGMPVFNDVAFIDASLRSILAQEDISFKLIISDDGSTDGSADICLDYASKDSRISYIRQPINLGISRNMEYLLAACDTPFFMWAGDDDLWDPRFCKILIDKLEQNPNAVSAFTYYYEIDEKDQRIEPPYTYDFSGKNAFTRIRKLVQTTNDGFGYGIFRYEAIKDVRFPVWWWPNKKTPYNNIFPTLCYYLAQGDYALYTEDFLFLKRVKTEKNTNHLLVGQGNGIKELSAYFLRRFNMVFICLRYIRRSQGFLLTFRLAPIIYYRWWIVSFSQQFSSAYRFIWKRIFQRS
ncbi:MAG: glycosyltransferase family 2 protein [Fluviicola sp.]|jgi:glycosyltransferase involved in cell wall biosynthesis